MKRNQTYVSIICAAKAELGAVWGLARPSRTPHRRPVLTGFQTGTMPERWQESRIGVQGKDARAQCLYLYTTIYLYNLCIRLGVSASPLVLEG